MEQNLCRSDRPLHIITMERNEDGEEDLWPSGGYGQYKD